MLACNEEGDIDAVEISDELVAENEWVLPVKFWEHQTPFQMRLLTRPDLVLIADNHCEPGFSLRLSKHEEHVSSWFQVNKTVTKS